MAEPVTPARKPDAGAVVRGGSIPADPAAALPPSIYGPTGLGTTSARIAARPGSDRAVEAPDRRPAS